MYMSLQCVVFLFFFQAEDGIRDADVTGVQTCALPIFPENFLSTFRDRGFEINVHDLNHDGSLFSDRKEFLRRANRINQRSEERRVGKEGRSRWSPYH